MFLLHMLLYRFDWYFHTCCPPQSQVRAALLLQAFSDHFKALIRFWGRAKDKHQSCCPNLSANSCTAPRCWVVRKGHRDESEVSADAYRLISPHLELVMNHLSKSNYHHHHHHHWRVNNRNHVTINDACSDNVIPKHQKAVMVIFLVYVHNNSD